MKKASMMLILLLLLATGCQRSQSDQPQTPPMQRRSVVVGIMTPLTGDVASWGDMQRKATELALSDLKGSGELGSLDLKVIYEDDKAEPKNGVNAFQKLVDADRAPIVVGSPASTVTLAVAPMANQQQVVLLSSGSTATAVGKAGPYVFRIMPSDEVQAKNMSDWALELGYKRIAIIYVENAWGRGLIDHFVTDLEGEGGMVVASESSKPDTTDFRAQLNRVRATKPDAIYAPLYTRAAGLMIRQAREMGIDQQFLGADVYSTPELVEAGGKAVNGVLYTTFGEYKGKEYQDFAQRYKSMYGREPENYASYCYDAFRIAIHAIHKIPQGRPVDGASIRQSLLSIKDYHGVTGLTNFSGRNSAEGKKFDRMMVVDGKNVPFSASRWKAVVASRGSTK
jgi:branched-chain amino acid transport system substrate-binding protein